MNHRRPLPRPLLSAVAIVLTTTLVGCGGKPAPKTYPAIGKITYKGGQPFVGGVVTFTSKSEPSRVMDSPIADDGSFELGIVFDKRRLPGGIPGPCQVLISSRFGGPDKGVEIYLLPDERVIEPRDNVFAIEVDPATARR